MYTFLHYFVRKRCLQLVSLVTLKIKFCLQCEQNPVGDHRRKWDRDEYEELARERILRDSEEKDKGPPVKRELLKPREYKVCVCRWVFVCVSVCVCAHVCVWVWV